jgi:hypothetical protein
MMPIASNTQTILPTQVPLTSTPMPGTSVARVLPDAVAPSVPDAKLGPDYKGNGGYVSPVISPPANSAAPPVLSFLIPPSLSTANATLSATAMFATQLLSQDAQAGGQFLSEYEAIVAASQVKYMPSNATQPQPAPNNLFARLLSETQVQDNARVAVQVKASPKEVAANVATALAPQAAQVARSESQPLKQRPVTSTAYAAGSYTATSSRNHTHLESDAPPVEAIIG